MNKQELISRLIELYEKSLEWRKKRQKLIEDWKNVKIAKKHSDCCKQLNGKIVPTVSGDYYEIEYSEVSEPKIKLFFKEGVKLDEN